jgi:predicted nucleic acid-binding protein
LECAIAGSATYVVTGDAHLLDLKAYQQIVMLDPAAFLAVLKFEEQ